MKPGLLKLTTSRGQRNLCNVFIFVSCEEKGCYRIVSLGHQNFDCRSYGKVQNMDPWSPSVDPVHGPGPLNMDRVHGPLFLPKHKQTKTT